MELRVFIGGAEVQSYRPIEEEKRKSQTATACSDIKVIQVPCSFSYTHYRTIIRRAKEREYRIMQMREYTQARPSQRVLLLRHDIDTHPECAERLARVERDLGVRSTYFVRVHTDMYNPFGFRVYPILRNILEMGHEIGLHFENTDMSRMTGEDARSILRREIDVLQATLGTRIEGIAAHVDLISGVNNDDINPLDYDIEYEARTLTRGFTFVSDSLRKWPHTNGRCICRILQDPHLNAARICLLTHPEFWYENRHKVQHL
jgi:hypothetical protein